MSAECKRRVGAQVHIQMKRPSHQQGPLVSAPDTPPWKYRTFAAGAGR